MRGLVGVAIASLLAANATAQIAPRTPDTLTLVRSVRMGRERGVAAMLARLNARVADTRIGQRRADLLPNLSAGASVTRQTLNLDEFGIPIAQGVTDPFSLFRLQVRVTQAVLDPAAWNRLKAARDSAVASGLDAVTAGTAAGATAGVAYLRALSAAEPAQNDMGRLSRPHASGHRNPRSADHDRPSADRGSADRRPGRRSRPQGPDAARGAGSDAA